MSNKSFLEQEIFEQPIIIDHLIQKEQAHIAALADKLKGKFNYILIAARGTSDNAARYAQYLFQIHNEIPVALATPSVFSIYKKHPNLDGALILAISQSGMSPDILSVLKEGKHQGRPTLAVTNNPESPLGELADDVISLHAGLEKAVAATKTYTASLVAMALLSMSLAHDDSMLATLKNLPDWTDQTIQKALSKTDQMERFHDLIHGVVIGRGFNYCTAFEIALKIKELTGITTVPYSSADFLHGPVASVHEGYPALVIAHHGKVFQDTKQVIERVNSLGANTLLISDDQDLCNQEGFSIQTPTGIPEWVSPVVNVIPGQVLGWQLAEYRGMDPDNPRGLKKVTKTR
jgi:glucosamine--fructose-6-phosphate aminotransferase (isomerizing)